MFGTVVQYWHDHGIIIIFFTDCIILMLQGYDEVEDEEGYVSVRLPVSPSSVQESVSKLPNRRYKYCFRFTILCSVV